MLLESIDDAFSLTTDWLVTLRRAHADAGRAVDVARVERALGYLRQARALAVVTERIEEMLEADPGRHGTGEEE